MKAKYVLYIAMVAVTSAAQQSGGSPATSVLKISPAEARAMLLEKVVPSYPEQATANHIQNNEILDIQIDEMGNVASAKIQSGHPWFAQASLEAVTQWKYRPYLQQGSPVRVESTVLIVYRVAGQQDRAPRFPQGMPASVVSIADAPSPPASPVDASQVEATQVEAPKHVQLDRKLLEDRVINQVQPTYPPIAKAAHIQGDVLLHVVIDKEGRVAQLRAVSGHPILIQAAMDAVKQWSYKPYEVRGEAVGVESTVRVEFRIDGVAKAD